MARLLEHQFHQYSKSKKSHLNNLTGWNGALFFRHGGKREKKATQGKGYYSSILSPLERRVPSQKIIGVDLNTFFR